MLALRRRFEALWIDAFARLKKAGLVRRADAMACRFFLSALHGVVNWYDPAGKLTPDELADELVDWVAGPGSPLRNASARSRSSSSRS